MPNRDRRNYGGFPIRSEIVKQKQAAKMVAAAKADNLYLEQYACCQCSLEKLSEPILISKMGKLYNKDNLFEYLIAKSTTVTPSVKFKKLSEKMKDVQTTKDVYEVKIISKNRNFPHESSNKDLDKELEDEKKSKFPFQCEISGLEMNGHARFVFGSKSKSIVSESALKEVNSLHFSSKANNDMTGGLVTDKIHPIYEGKIEDKLMCPVTNVPFGRPILLYPSEKLHIERADKFLKKGQKKKRKQEANKGEESEACSSSSKEAKKAKN